MVHRSKLLASALLLSAFSATFAHAYDAPVSVDDDTRDDAEYVCCLSGSLNACTSSSLSSLDWMLKSNCRSNPALEGICPDSACGH